MTGLMSSKALTRGAVIAVRVLNKDPAAGLPSRYGVDDGTRMHTDSDLDIGLLAGLHCSDWLRGIGAPHVVQRCFSAGDVIVIYVRPAKGLVWMAKRGHGLLLPPTRLPPGPLYLAVAMRAVPAAVTVEAPVGEDFSPELLNPAGQDTPRAPDDLIPNVVIYQ